MAQNLLWRDGNVYLMDNHRAALWCWQQHLDLYSDPHSLIHIDRHYDALGSNLRKHVQVMPDLRGLSITDYLGARVKLGDQFPLFRWDNYLSLYLAAICPKLQTFRCLTRHDGDKPLFEGMMEPEPQDLPQNFDYLLERGRWIVNIDLDYFFCASAADDRFTLMYSDAYLKEVFEGLRRAIDLGDVAVVTLCLTPSNFTAGWEACIKLSKKIFRAIGRRHPRI